MRHKWRLTPLQRECLLVSLVFLSVVAIPFATSRDGIVNEGLIVKQGIQAGGPYAAKGKLQLYYSKPEVQPGSHMECNPVSCDGYVCCLTKEGHRKLWNIHIR